MENQNNQRPSAAAQDATSYSQDSANNQRQSSAQGQSSDKGGVLGGITSTLSNIQLPDAVKNVQLPQAVKDFGASCARSYSNMSTAQKVVGGAALLGASYWVANNQGWIGQAKASSKRNRSTATSGTQHS